GHTSLVTAVAVSPDGTRIASASADHTIRLWDAKRGQAIGEPLEGHEDTVATLAFSPDGSRLVSGSADKTIRVWDVTTGQPVGTPLSAHGADVLTAGFTADGRRLMTGGFQPSLRLWDASTFQPIRAMDDNQEVRSVAISPDGSRAIAAGRRPLGGGDKDDYVRQWDLASGETVGDWWEGHTQAVNGVAWSRDGGHIVSASDDGTILLWDPSTARSIAAL